MTAAIRSGPPAEARLDRAWCGRSSWPCCYEEKGCLVRPCAHLGPERESNAKDRDSANGPCGAKSDDCETTACASATLSPTAHCRAVLLLTSMSVGTAAITRGSLQRAFAHPSTEWLETSRRAGDARFSTAHGVC